MAQESKAKMNKSSLVTRVGGIVAVLALVSAGLTHVREITEIALDWIGQDKCYNVKLNYKEKVQYSRLNAPNVFEVHADNECSYDIMIRVEFSSLDSRKLKINADHASDPNSWPEYTIKAKQKEFRKRIILPNLFFLTDEREFPVQIKWIIFKRQEMGGEEKIHTQTQVFKIVDDDSISAR